MTDLAKLSAAATQELLPCPFCGGGNVHPHKHFWQTMLCVDCGAEGPCPRDMDEDYTEAEAVAAWNQRACVALSAEVIAEMVTEAARTALFKVDANARTGVTNPVNGSAAFSYVTFCGEVKHFHDGEFTIQMHRDAGSAKAGQYAQRINDALFAIAKEAATDALVNAYRANQLVERGAGVEAGRVALRKSAEGWRNVVELDLLPRQHIDTANDLADQCSTALAALGGPHDAG